MIRLTLHSTPSFAFANNPVMKDTFFFDNFP